MEISPKVYWDAALAITDILSLMPHPLPFRIVYNSAFLIGNNLQISPEPLTDDNILVSDINSERIKWLWIQSSPTIDLNRTGEPTRVDGKHKTSYFWNDLKRHLIAYVNSVMAKQA